LTSAGLALTSTLEAQRAFTTAGSTAAHAHETLAKTLAGVGLPDAAAAEAAILDEALAAQYRLQIEEFDAEVVSVAAGLQDMADVDLDRTVDVADREHEVAQRQQAHATAQQVLGSLQHTLTGAVPMREQIRERETEHARVLEETAGVIRMADLATATRGEGIHRVRLSAFVLMRRFESVVEAANDRLDAISEGRYQLQVEHRGLDNRGQHGLDLLVEDQRTQRCRPTTSLSGGESFYVSLALALGLADVVRSESGGVSLGTLFIDEGFGSLDSDVLEEVMDMLEQVRAGEDRVIGLVSHVDLLKQRIDPRISVRRDPQRPGVSTLEVHV
jgi:exonuclease SbcC